ncbi:WD40-repeat-containing domain protein [Kockovaella imperatae]|uniref:WD40-repeat-containing domain protein n=1 Tax=Kockovaella imperatae TaxID=4999 RepID=A0A1Y1UD20_9TREE|nr:WD40-repeat-containing domain protein [Kockovaella imperatae]ORX34965.1 WD40-repeat-containing domain protein [Kockovaella imperatae]
MSLSYLQHESTPVLPESVWALAWTPLDHIISGSADGHIRVHSATDLSVPLQDAGSHPLAITSLSVTEDGRRSLSTSLDGTVVLFDPLEGRDLDRLDTSREKVDGDRELPAFSCAVHPSMKCWAWSGRSSKIAMRSISQADHAESSTNGDGVGRSLLSGETKLVETGKGKFGMDLKFSPDGQMLALATESGHVIVLDTETQAIIATYQSHAMATRTISWSPDSQWLLSGSDDHLIVIHDVRAGSKSGAGGRGEGAVGMMQGHQSWVLSVAASPDGKLLGSGGADGVIKLWDIGQRTAVYSNSSSAEVWGFDWQPVSANSNASGKQFAIGEDNTVSLYRAAGSV